MPNINLNYTIVYHIIITFTYTFILNYADYKSLEDGELFYDMTKEQLKKLLIHLYYDNITIMI